MTNIEKLREQLAIEENDLKALGIGKQLIREERNERFEETYLPKLQAKCNVKHDVSCSFYDFAKKYIRIKDGANERSFNNEELKRVEEMQQMMDKGYELKLVHLRKGSKIMWCKKNCT